MACTTLTTQQNNSDMEQPQIQPQQQDGTKESQGMFYNYKEWINVGASELLF